MEGQIFFEVRRVSDEVILIRSEIPFEATNVTFDRTKVPERGKSSELFSTYIAAKKDDKVEVKI